MLVSIEITKRHCAEGRRKRLVVSFPDICAAIPVRWISTPPMRAKFTSCSPEELPWSTGMRWGMPVWIITEASRNVFQILLARMFETNFVVLECVPSSINNIFYSISIQIHDVKKYRLVGATAVDTKSKAET